MSLGAASTTQGMGSHHKEKQCPVAGDVGTLGHHSCVTGTAGGFGLLFFMARSQLAVGLKTLSKFWLSIWEEDLFQGFAAFSAAIFLLWVYEAFEVSLISWQSQGEWEEASGKGRKLKI